MAGLFPWLLQCIYNQGNKFVGFGFQHMLRRNHITGQPAASKNLQANAIFERMHQTVGNSLQAMSNMNPLDGVVTTNCMVDTAIANCVYAMRSAFHGTLKASPGLLAFGRDMVLDIPLQADWELICQQ